MTRPCRRAQGAYPTSILRRRGPASIIAGVRGLAARTTADLERARDAVDWVSDDDLRDVESKSTPGATALGALTWGGSHLYLGDIRVGLAGIVALIGWVALAPASVGAIGYWLVGALSAVWSYRRARAVNRFVAIRNELALRQGPDPSTYRLLAAAAAANPALAPMLPALPAGRPAASPHHAPLVDRLRKLAALHRAGVLHDPELHDRKIDLLAEATPATRDELDELLYALLPLADEGVLGADDFDFLKRIGPGAEAPR